MAVSCTACLSKVSVGEKKCIMHPTISHCCHDVPRPRRSLAHVAVSEMRLGSVYKGQREASCPIIPNNLSFPLDDHLGDPWELLGRTPERHTAAHDVSVIVSGRHLAENIVPSGLDAGGHGDRAADELNVSTGAYVPGRPDLPPPCPAKRT